MRQEYVQWIYESVTGQLVEEYRCKKVENLFDDGMPCMNLYEEAIKAGWRICERLGTEEDRDVERMINSLLEMGRIVAFRMFAYGAEFEGGKDCPVE